MTKRIVWALLIGLIVGSGLTVSFQPIRVTAATAPLFNLQGKTDSNNALVVTLATAGSVGAATSTMANLQAKVDSNNALVISCPDGTCAASASPTFTGIVGITNDAGAAITNWGVTAVGAIRLSQTLDAVGGNVTAGIYAITEGASSGAVTGELDGGYFAAETFDARNYTYLTGFGALAYHQGTGTVTNLIANASEVSTYGTTSNTTNEYGATYSLRIDGGTVAQVTGIRLGFTHPAGVLGAGGLTGYWVDQTFASAGPANATWPFYYTTAGGTDFFVDRGGGVAAPQFGTDKTTAHTATLRAYDVDGAAYSTFATLTNGNTPDFTVAPPAGGTITIQTSTLKTGAAVTDSATAPTISSGFGTSPSIPSNNGTAAFTINVGTGGTATDGVLGLPTATTGWNCQFADITTPATNDTVQTASSTTTATVANYGRVTGLLVAWPASDIVRGMCRAY